MVNIIKTRLKNNKGIQIVMIYSETTQDIVVTDISIVSILL